MGGFYVYNLCIKTTPACRNAHFGVQAGAVWHRIYLGRTRSKSCAFVLKNRCEIIATV